MKCEKEIEMKNKEKHEFKLLITRAAAKKA